MDLYRKKGPFEALEQIGNRMMIEKEDDNEFLDDIHGKLDSI